MKMYKEKIHFEITQFDIFFLFFAHISSACLIVYIHIYRRDRREVQKEIVKMSKQSLTSGRRSVSFFIFFHFLYRNLRKNSNHLKKKHMQMLKVYFNFRKIQMLCETAAKNADENNINEMALKKHQKIRTDI